MHFPGINTVMLLRNARGEVEQTESSISKVECGIFKTRHYITRDLLRCSEGSMMCEVKSVTLIEVRSVVTRGGRKTRDQAKNKLSGRAADTAGIGNLWLVKRGRCVRLVWSPVSRLSGVPSFQ